MAHTHLNPVTRNGNEICRLCPEYEQKVLKERLELRLNLSPEKRKHFRHYLYKKKVSFFINTKGYYKIVGERGVLNGILRDLTKVPPSKSHLLGGEES